MTYRVHKDGYIQCRILEVRLNDEDLYEAQNVGLTRNDGIVRVLANVVGIEVEGAERYRSTPDLNRAEMIVRVESDWVRPSRR